MGWIILNFKNHRKNYVSIWIWQLWYICRRRNFNLVWIIWGRLNLSLVIPCNSNQLPLII